MNKAIIFLFGAGVGSAITYLVLNKKKINEIEDIREHYRAKAKELKGEDPDESVDDFSEEDNKEYEACIDDNGYLNYSDISQKSNEKEVVEEKSNPDIMVIDPEEFGQDDEYDIIELTYYKNGVVTDDLGDRMSNEEVENSITWMAITKIGEYEADAVHIRNDITKTYYEVLQVSEDYKEE